MKQLLKVALSDLPRGKQSRIAEALHVEPATVTKWKKGYTLPMPDQWLALEELLGMTAGTLSGNTSVHPPVTDPFDRIRAEIAELRARVEVLEAGRVTNEEFAVAAHSGRFPYREVALADGPDGPGIYPIGEIVNPSLKGAGYEIVVTPTEGRKRRRPSPRPEQGEHVDA